MCCCCFLSLSVLHLAVLHNQQEALKNLSQVVSVLPGQEVLNMRNHLYQVLYFETLSRKCSVCPDVFVPSSHLLHFSLCTEF